MHPPHNVVLPTLYPHDQNGNPLEKTCAGPCGRTLPATTEFFYRYKKDGLRPRCKACILTKAKEYYKRPEIRKHILAYQGSPEARKHVRIYRSQPEVRAKYSTYRHNRRAHEKSVKGTYASEQLQEQLKRQKHKCYYCQKRFQKTKGTYIYHIDHTFPLSRVVGTDIPANSIDYLVMTCPTCNLSKGNKFPWEFPEGGRLL